MNGLPILPGAARSHRRARSLLLAAATALSVPAFAQNVQNASGGLPQDWSHRHLIYSSPAAEDDLDATGDADEWSSKANDPRFVAAFERKERLSASTISGSGAAAPRLKVVAKQKPPPARIDPPLPHRDWSNVMGGASGVGSAGVYPAKFNFGVDTKD